MAANDNSFQGTGREYMTSKVNFWALLMGIFAAIVAIATYIKGVSFGRLGANVTIEVRKMLYESILRKNIGWFDNRDNAVSVLTSAMA